jgi:GNAT superfamily N-acetyltransferase
VLVRPRSDGDLDRCADLARVVQQRDGYPPHVPSELRRFIAPPDAIAAWVAESTAEIVGHASLHRTSSDEVMALASQVTGRPAEELGVVARLFVSPAARRSGVGLSLLSTATADAVARGLWPILDVGAHFAPAINLYEKCGWVRAGEVAVPFRGQTLREFVYLGPEPQEA